MSEQEMFKLMSKVNREIVQDCFFSLEEHPKLKVRHMRVLRMLTIRLKECLDGHSQQLTDA